MQPPSLRRLGVVLACVLAVGACATVEDPSPSPTATSTATESPMPTFAPESTVGGLAPGFPVEFALLPTETDVVASAAEIGTPLTRISLTLRSFLTVEEVNTYYTELLTGIGFLPVEMQVPQGLAAFSGYSRANAELSVTETITVAVLDNESSRSISLSGDVVPAPS